MGQPREAWYSIVERNGNCRLQEVGFGNITNSRRQTLNAFVKNFENSQGRRSARPPEAADARKDPERSR